MRAAPTITTTFGGGGSAGIVTYSTLYAFRYGYNGSGISATDYTYTASSEL